MWLLDVHFYSLCYTFTLALASGEAREEFGGEGAERAPAAGDGVLMAAAAEPDEGELPEAALLDEDAGAGPWKAVRGIRGHKD